MQQLLIIHGQEREEEEQVHDKPFFYSRLPLDLSFDLFVSRDLVLRGNNNNSREDDDGIVSVCHKLTFDIQVNWTVVTLRLTDGALVLRWAFQFNLLPCLVVLAALGFLFFFWLWAEEGRPFDVNKTRWMDYIVRQAQ